MEKLSVTVKKKLEILLIKDFSIDQIYAFSFWILPHLETFNPKYHDAELTRICQELKNRKPIQYIFGLAFFGDLQLYVNLHTLIPRPETEELCQFISVHFKDKDNIRGLDIGTGSGCIPIYLLSKHPHWKFEAMDINANILDVAESNARKYGLHNSIYFHELNVFTMTTLPNDIQLLVSNPPYVGREEMETLATDVLNYEPHSALFSPTPDSMLFYKKIAELVSNSAIKKLSIWLEINQYKGLETLALFEPIGETKLHFDMSGNTRFLHCEIARP